MTGQEKPGCEFLHSRVFPSLFRKLLPVAPDLLFIAVLLREDTAAVLLHIEPQLPGPLVPRPEVGTEVPVEERYAIPLCAGLRRPDDAVVVLVEAGQKGGGEGSKAVLRGVFRRPLPAPPY